MNNISPKKIYDEQMSTWKDAYSLGRCKLSHNEIPFMSIWTANIRETDNTEDAKDTEGQGRSPMAGGSESNMVQARWERGWRFLKKFNMHPAYYPGVPRWYPHKDNEKLTSTQTWMRIVLAAPFVTTTEHNLSVLSAGEWKN